MLDTEAFAKAYEKYLPRTTALLLSRRAPPELAEETSQAAWVRGWERRYQLRSDSLVLPWINSIALNILRGHFRNQYRSIQFPVGSEAALEAPPTMSLNDEFDLDKLLNHCKPRDRELMIAYWGCGFTSREIAMRLGVRPVTVRVRIRRAVRALPSHLLPHSATAMRKSA